MLCRALYTACHILADREGYAAGKRIFFPEKFSVEAYSYVVSGTSSILQGYSISVFMTLVGTLCTLTLTTLYDYSLSRKDLPGWNILRSYGFSTIMMRTYLNAGVSDTVTEAARIDGASEFKILRSIVIPMGKPIPATQCLLAGLSYWNDWGERPQLYQR